MDELFISPKTEFSYLTDKSLNWAWLVPDPDNPGGSPALDISGNLPEFADKAHVYLHGYIYEVLAILTDFDSFRLEMHIMDDEVQIAYQGRIVAIYTFASFTN